jgi:hypothetical protein
MMLPKFKHPQEISESFFMACVAQVKSIRGGQKEFSFIL